MWCQKKKEKIKWTESKINKIVLDLEEKRMLLNNMAVAYKGHTMRHEILHDIILECI